MTPSNLVDQLAALPTFASVPQRELDWLVAHGTLVEYPRGAVIAPKNEPVKFMYILLAGRISILIDRGAGPHKMSDWRKGAVTGLLPYSRLTTPPGETIAEEPITALAISRDHFDELIRECREVTTRVVHAMLDRARAFTSNDLHDEKMKSLGRLAAGLAHELNNPASAIERGAVLLNDRFDESEQATLALGAACPTAEQLAAVRAFRTECLQTATTAVRSPLQRAEREEAIADWLADRGLDERTAEALADTAVTFDALDRLAAVLDEPLLRLALRYAATGCTVRAIGSDIEEAATRVSGLVAAIKGFTHMDQAAIPEPVALLYGLETTVAVLRSKARAKSASVVVDVEPDLPRVRGFAGELNQIWANLLDNALDAISENGRVDIVARRDGGHVVVRVIDNGTGIPDAALPRVFDPFFTTKSVGQGTGLGLDIVRRLVEHNEGDITVESAPGRTEFRVSLWTV